MKPDSIRRRLVVAVFAGADPVIHLAFEAQTDERSPEK